ncbi:MAG: DUF2147 domain-containing protein [Rhodomicrobium sp.]|nr:DUF2147 domain-containing protein [Rhodomicrobium sp.]
MKKLSLAIVIALAPFAAHAAGLKGEWLTEEGKGRVLFEDCGSKLCGRIVWLKQPNDESGKPLADGLNKDKSLRNRPIMGLKLTELKSDGNGGWKGTIYNPEEGKSYNAEAGIQEDGTLLIKGCLLGGLLCGDETWKRIN